MNIDTALPYIAFALGVALRVFVPYLQTRLNTDGPLAFDWRFLVGQLIGAFVALIPMISGSEFVAELGSLGWLGAILYGWGSADVGRKAQKFVKPNMVALLVLAVPVIMPDGNFWAG